MPLRDQTKPVPYYTDQNTKLWPCGHEPTWSDRSTTWGRSLRAPSTSGTRHCGLLVAVAISNRAPLLYSLNTQGTTKINHRTSLSSYTQILRTLTDELRLTPSGFTTLVTVTDWKKERVLGCTGGWAEGGLRIWSRPPEDTAESRSEQREKSVWKWETSCKGIQVGWRCDLPRSSLGSSSGAFCGPRLRIPLNY